MYAVSGKLIWLPLYLSIIALVIFRYRRKAYIIVPVLILTVVVSDQLSVHAFKEVFMRLRPCREPSLAGLVHTVNGKCPGLYGFVSSHASNSFSVAMISLLFVNRRWFTISMLTWAAIIGYSRIYLGVHYPGDVICGAILGLAVGYIIFRLFILLDNKILKRSHWLSGKKCANASD
jgi:undecaprenyl-diphosphatase